MERCECSFLSISFFLRQCGNILLDVNGCPKLADFGLTAHIGAGEEANQACGTPLFMAPEVVSGEEHDYSADVWSLGTNILLFSNPRKEDIFLDAI